MPDRKCALRPLLAILMAGSLGTLPALADERANAFDYCLVCHGSAAGGNAVIGGPNLTTLDDWYLERQLLGFRSGYRGWHPEDHAGHSMVSAARMLDSDEHIAEAVAFIGGYADHYPASETVDGDADRGRSHYESCAVCHGAAGEGNESLGAPALRGQNDWYLVKQLEDYRAGRRGAQPGDSQGAIMRAAALQIVDETAVKDLGTYIQAAFRPAPPTLAGSDPVAAGAADEDKNSKEEDAMKNKLTTTMGAAALALAAPSVLSHDVTRYPLPNGSTFPIAQAVTVPAGTELTFHSGLLPAPADPEAEPGTRAYLGDTYTQTMSVLQQFEASLKAKGMGLGNIIKMNVFLVGDPELDGKMDFAGFMRAYSQFFGTEEQPHLPARAAVQIAGLARGAFIEIEVIAAR